ncbi:MAG: hypothetical protein IOD12_07995 [Silvanigrellales bacterium]|nr:hypothetical protein [Silvanigrellales bacterium]
MPRLIWNLEAIYKSEDAWRSACKKSSVDGMSDLAFYVRLRETLEPASAFVVEARSALHALKAATPRESQMPTPALIKARALTNASTRDYRSALNLNFGEVVASDETRYALNVSSCGHLMRHPDPAVRAGASRAWNATLARHRSSLESRFLNHFRTPAYQVCKRLDRDAGFFRRLRGLHRVVPALYGTNPDPQGSAVDPAHVEEKLLWSDFLYAPSSRPHDASLELTSVIELVTEALARIDAAASARLRRAFLPEGGGRIHDTSDDFQGLSGAECSLSSRHGAWIKVHWDGSPTAALFLAHELGHAFEHEQKRGQSAGAARNEMSEFVSTLSEILAAQALDLDPAFVRRWFLTRFAWQTMLADFQDQLGEPPNDLQAAFECHLSKWFGGVFALPVDVGVGVLGCTPLLFPYAPHRYALDLASAFVVANQLAREPARGSEAYFERMARPRFDLPEFLALFGPAAAPTQETNHARIL